MIKGSEAQKQKPYKLLWMLWFDEKSISNVYRFSYVSFTILFFLYFFHDFSLIFLQVIVLVLSTVHASRPHRPRHIPPPRPSNRVAPHSSPSNKGPRKRVRTILEATVDALLKKGRSQMVRQKTRHRSGKNHNNNNKPKKLKKN